MASFQNCAPGSSSRDQPCNDSAWLLRAIALTQESGDGTDMGSLSWRVGANTALRRKLLLHGLPIHADQELHEAMDPPATYMAAQAS